MNRKTRFLGYSIITVVLAFGAVVLFPGCQKEKPAAPQTSQAASSVAQPTAQTAEQTKCPIMGGPVNKAISIEYQGKQVYFCCNGCPDAFKADPEKYVSQLPQFAK